MNCTTYIQLSGTLRSGQAKINAAIPVTEFHVSRIAAGRRHGEVLNYEEMRKFDVAQRWEGHDRSRVAQPLRLHVRRFTCALDRRSAV